MLSGRRHLVLASGERAGGIDDAAADRGAQHQIMPMSAIGLIG
jgi:hypothetical protein